MMNNSFTTQKTTLYDLKKPDLTLKVPVNVNKILIADIDNDNKNELILARTDRILHVFRLEPTKDQRGITKYGLIEINMWVFDGQISSLCTTQHPDRPHESLLLVAQPGNTFTIIDKDGKRYNRDFSPQDQPVSPMEKEDIEILLDDTCETTGDDENYKRTNYLVKNWPLHTEGGDESVAAVATEIVVGKRQISGNTFTNEIGILSMDGKFSIYDLKTKTISHRDLFVTHKLFSLATLDMSRSAIRTSQEYTRPSGIQTSQLKQSSEAVVVEDSEESEESDKEEELSSSSSLSSDEESLSDEESDEEPEESSNSSSDEDSWGEASSESEETPGCDLFVACAWNGVTYLIDWSRRIEDSKIKYQLVKFAFEGRVCAFTAGLYAVDSEENLPCLFYVDFEDQIYVYYDVRVSAGPVSSFIDVIDDDVEEAIDRIIGIEGAIESLIESEQNTQQNLQKKTTEEEDTIDLGDGWRGVANEEECGFIKQNESDPLNLADFIHECLYEFDSMKDKLEKEVLSFEQNTLSNRLPPAADIRRLSDLNISIEPTLDNEIVSETGSIIEEEEEEGTSGKYIYTIPRSEGSSDEYDNDIHIASWIEGSLIASSIFKQEEDMSSEGDS
ncbi:hypothetical protein G6F56_002409 [Rhizopus delemar]|nr:hypothetical protein G6F56_002409 [Rhizopus delemar]